MIGRAATSAIEAVMILNFVLQCDNFEIYEVDAT